MKGGETLRVASMEDSSVSDVARRPRPYWRPDTHLWKWGTLENQ